MTMRTTPTTLSAAEILKDWTEHFQSTTWDPTPKLTDSWGQPMCLHPEQQAERERQFAEAEQAKQAQTSPKAA